MYSYRASVKSDVSDELINSYVLRPLAGCIVWALYDTPVTPNQVTILSTIAGCIAAVFYIQGTPEACILAGLCVTLKDILDSADGQLARAKQQFSRIGRFLDSIGDFVVNIAVFGAIGWTLFRVSGDWQMLVLAVLGCIGISLRVSYHVFYQVQYLHLQNEYLNNRTSEEIQEEDVRRGGRELILQQIFQMIYGWQDRLVLRIDRWNRGESFRKLPVDVLADPLEEITLVNDRRWRDWYSDVIGLRISGLLGFGTELFLLMICSVLNNLELYLFLNIFLMNGILLSSIFYRRFILAKHLSKHRMDREFPLH
jgi:phosphatidylglycerophosphate synthase